MAQRESEDLGIRKMIYFRKTNLDRMPVPDARLVLVGARMGAQPPQILAEWCNIGVL